VSKIKQRYIYANPLRFNPNTPIKLYAGDTTYVPGEGNTTQWTQIISDSFETYYCEWTGSFGDRAMSAEALGVKDSATIRMSYNPYIYEKLRTVKVVILKNADTTGIVEDKPDKNNPNVYELWGGVDNVKEGNLYMEFRVRRYEGL